MDVDIEAMTEAGWTLTITMMDPPPRPQGVIVTARRGDEMLQRRGFNYRKVIEQLSMDMTGTVIHCDNPECGAPVVVSEDRQRAPSSSRQKFCAACRADDYKRARPWMQRERRAKARKGAQRRAS
jgi:hypothetical protein